MTYALAERTAGILTTYCISAVSRLRVSFEYGEPMDSSYNGGTVGERPRTKVSAFIEFRLREFLPVLPVTELTRASSDSEKAVVLVTTVPLMI